jgi:hypothetical protein
VAEGALVASGRSHLSAARRPQGSDSGDPDARQFGLGSSPGSGKFPESEGEPKKGFDSLLEMVVRIVEGNSSRGFDR